MRTPEILLGLECGGTRTVALATDFSLRPLARITAGPCNLRLVSDAQLTAHFKGLRAALPAPDAIGVGMAGVRDLADCGRIERILEQVWPGVPRRADHDLESALAAAELDERRWPNQAALAARVIVLSGTGSCCYGRKPNGETAKVGGWGHLLGDRGSAYDIAFRALRASVLELDHTGNWGRFGQAALQSLNLNEPNDLIAWLQTASKTEVAALAPEVFKAANAGDRVARAIITQTIDLLASDALACARRLVPRRARVEFVLSGSVLLEQAGLIRALKLRLRAERPNASVKPLARESVWGAVAMARSATYTDTAGSVAVVSEHAQPLTSLASVSPPPVWLKYIPVSRELSPTEQRNPHSTHLDRLSVTAAMNLMLTEDAAIPAAIRSHRVVLARLIQRVVQTFRQGGRLFYVGAGTSGRLGVLDASECPPTFSTPPEWVQGIIAGGQTALQKAVEGAEDDFAAGGRALEFRRVRAEDIVLGIAASGRTPFVWGALNLARERGATTALLCFNPFLQFAPNRKPDFVLAVDVGPEVLTGSTRLKAGTATKVILNLITTLAMVRLGKVMGNFMVDLNPSNVKLRDRACRMVTELTGREPAAARQALEQAGWRVKEAVRAWEQSKRSVLRETP